MLAVTGGKGGVGKTTTALGVAVALARATAARTDGGVTTRAGRDRATGPDSGRGSGSEGVLVVDADRDLPDLARAAGVEADRVDPATLGPRPGRPLPDAPSARVVTAPIDRHGTRRLLDSLAERPERVVVDCPAGAGRPAAVPLAAADRSLLVATPDPASLRDAAKTAAMARALDAPPTATVCNLCETLPSGSKRLLPPPVIAIPDVRDPLSNGRALDRYRDVSERATLRNG